MGSVRYRIDAQDRITALLDGWPRGEASPGGWDRVIGRELWSCMEDPTTIELYRTLVKLARARGAVRIPYRCDTARQRRWFEMAIAPVEAGVVEFTSVLLRAENRPAVRLLEDDAPRDERLVRMCSWCQRVALPTGAWAEIEEAVREMRLLERARLPRITHGICRACADEMRRQLDAVR